MLETTDLYLEQTEFLNAPLSLVEPYQNTLLGAALHYAEIGYPVFPLHNVIRFEGIPSCSCMQRQNCPSIAKHPRTKNGFLEATTDRNRIMFWWTKYPSANIGILTGEESGIFVLDVDVKSGGKYSLDDLIHYYTVYKGKESFPATLTAITGSGGFHYYFKYLLDFGVKSSAGVIGDGLDIRGDGAYIIAPPSMHISGGSYRWFGDNTPILDAPDWLVKELIEAENRTKAEGGSELKKKNPIRGKVHEGNRHDTLFRHICGLVNTFPKAEVLRRALEVNATMFEPPLPSGYVTAQVEYLYTRYGRQSLNMGLAS